MSGVIKSHKKLKTFFKNKQMMVNKQIKSIINANVEKIKSPVIKSYNDLEICDKCQDPMCDICQYPKCDACEYSFIQGDIKYTKEKECSNNKRRILCYKCVEIFHQTISCDICQYPKCDACEYSFIQGDIKFTKESSNNKRGILCYKCAEIFFVPISCDICGDEYKYPKTFIKVCSNNNCIGNICDNCTKRQYDIPLNYKGKIDRSKVVCAFCGFLIVPTCTNVSPFVKHLFCSSLIDKKNQIISKSDSIADMISLGTHRIWICESKICKDPNQTSSYPIIFDCPKLPCLEEINNENNEENLPMQKLRICPKCTEYEFTNDLGTLKELGFIVDSGYPARKCPGCCRIYERDMNSCPRMQCTMCSTHFCHCCGKKFNSTENIYQHLKYEYQTLHPTIFQIKNYLKNLC